MKSNSLNILYISNEDVPNSHAGALHTFEVARGLAARGHRITLLSAPTIGRPPTEQLDGVDIIRTNMRLRGVKSSLRALWLLPQLKKTRWDAVMERYLTLNGLGMLVANAQNAPYLLEVNSPHLSEVYFRWGNENKLSGEALKFWVDKQFSRADLSFAPNTNTIPKECKVAKKIIWGVDDTAFGRHLKDAPETLALRSKLNLEGKFVILFVGSFHPWQGVTDLPDIIEATSKKLPNVKFIIVGDGPHFAEVITATEQRNLSDYCIFLGRQSHNQMPYLTAASDIGLAPFNDTYYPPLQKYGFFWAPTKVLEYAAGGLPIVCANYPILDELIINGETGILVPPADFGAYADAIVQLAQNDEMRNSMAKKAEEYVKSSYNWREHNRILEDFLYYSIKIRNNRNTI